MKKHDLRLSDWGPYNKNYLGVSHIADKDRGVRFDFNLFPGFYRRSVMNVKDICDSGTKIMHSSADLSHFVYRYELIWKDELYVDADYKADDNGKMTVECLVVNNTNEPQSITLNGCASVHFPTFYRKNLDVLTPPENWVDAVDYETIITTQKLAVDALKLGEKRISGFVGASGIDGGQFGERGELSYKFKNKLADKIYVKYAAKENFSMEILVNAKKYKVDFDKNDTLKCIEIEKDNVSSLKLFMPKRNYAIDGFVIGDFDGIFEAYTDDFVPEITKYEKGITLKYKFGTYDISWDAELFEIREFYGENIDQMLIDVIHNHVNSKFYYDDKGHFTNIFVRPVFVDANSKKTITFCIKSDKKKVNVNNSFSFIPINTDGEKYKLSQDIMSANTLTNVVFPIYCKGEYIRHNTPGRLWDSLYTWDSGFIGMGLNTLDKTRAEDCLNTYLTEPDDIHSPLIFHGSVVPTQMLLYFELWSSYTDIDLIKKYYPGMLLYYKFFSDICKDKGIGKTWDIFYNSGGWDDYPPQKYVNDNRLGNDWYPVITSAMTVICAKIMKNIAKKLGEDTSGFEKDISSIGASIQKYMWDDEAGYYSYVKFGDNIEFLRYKGDKNYNMGFDGIYPYIAGISNDYQSERIVENIRNGLMTKYGVSVVDLRAPYYKKDGYWNGSVWMPHQWILWKSLLDRGEIDLANHIAKTALDVWQKEVKQTYNCYEHFMIENGRGVGFHQFSGLSTPVLMWYKTYYSPNTMSVGFETMLDNISYDNILDCDIVNTTGKSCAIICLDEKYDYDFYIDNEKCEIKKITNGAYSVKIKCGHLSAVKRQLIYKDS